MQNRLTTIAVVIAFAAVILLTVGSISGTMRAPKSTGSGTDITR